MSIVCLQTLQDISDQTAQSLPSKEILRTCKIPFSSLSPRNLTNTRSLRDSLIRSNGSWIPSDVPFMANVVLIVVEGVVYVARAE